MIMDKEEKDIDECLDWLDGAGTSGRPDDEDLHELRRMADDCNRVFARKAHDAPDVDAAWRQFRDTHRAPRRRRLRRAALWGGWAGMAACLAVLVWMALARPEAEEHEPVLMFTAVHESQEVTLSAEDGAVWKLGDRQAGQALDEQGIAADERVADYRKTEQTSMQTLTVPRGKDYHLVLADGTEVWINAESRLHYPARFTGDTRTVRLEGEAYFKVARDEQHPFVVETAHLKTRVLGTEFNLQSYAGEASSVTLVTGRVAVQTDHSAEQISLMPGQELTLEADGTSPTLQNVDTYARTQWKEGYFYFDRASLEEILHGLGRWYNVDIELDCDPALLDYHLHYVANRHGTLAEALEKLNNLKRVTVVQEGNRIVLK